MEFLDLKPSAEFDESFFNVDIENQNYIFRVRWNERAGRWFLTVADPDNVVIATTPLLIDTPLLKQYPVESLFTETLILVGNKGPNDVYTQEDLSLNCNLLLTSSAAGDAVTVVRSTRVVIRSELIPGPRGEVGPRGIQGEVGPVGPAGPVGPEPTFTWIFRGGDSTPFVADIDYNRQYVVMAGGDSVTAYDGICNVSGGNA